MACLICVLCLTRIARRIEMKKYLCLLGMISLWAGADAADLIDTAQVVSSVPVYERVAKRQRECWTETVPVDAPKEHSVGGAVCLLYTSPSPRDRTRSRMPSSA